MLGIVKIIGCAIVIVGLVRIANGQKDLDEINAIILLFTSGCAFLAMLLRGSGEKEW